MRILFLAIAGLVAAPVAAETLNANGARFHYSVKGSGEPLLLLHGFGSCAADWGAIGDKLATTNKVILFDARGHGGSTNPSGKFGHKQAAEDVRALLDALKIEKVRAIGFSSGAMTMLQLASRYPERVAKMVVVGGTYEFQEQARYHIVRSTMTTLPPDVLAAFRQCAPRGEEQVKALVSQFQALGSTTDDMAMTPAVLARIKAKTMIVHGDRDFFFPVAIPVHLYANIKGSSLWIVPNGDHEPTGGADEDVFVAEVKKFMAE